MQDKDTLSYMEFKGQSFLVSVEKEVPYIYSTKQSYKDPQNLIPKWEGGFDKGADLTFGIGHSITSQEEFEEISRLIKECAGNDGQINALIQHYYKNDLESFVKQVNEFCFPDLKDKDECIILKQNEFDAIVLLLFNMNFPLEGSDLGNALKGRRGEDSPEFTQEEIILGFTYTLVNDVRNEGLVNRRNSELNLFFTGRYDYYDSKIKIKELGIDHIKYEE